MVSVSGPNHDSESGLTPRLFVHLAGNTVVENNGYFK